MSKLGFKSDRLLALKKRFPLWVELGDVDVYNDNNEYLSSIYMETKLCPDVLNALIDTLRSDVQLLSNHQKVEEGLFSLSQDEQSAFVKNGNHNQLKKWSAVNLDTNPIFRDKETVEYSAFPTFSENGDSIILKQIGHLKPKKGGQLIQVHLPVSLKLSDVFAYVVDVEEYIRAMAEDYCIGREKNMRLYEVKSFTTIVHHLKDAGLERDFTDEPHRRPMIKKTDHIELIDRKKIKRFEPS